MILKPNMGLPGLACSQQASVDEVANATVMTPQAWSPMEHSKVRPRPNKQAGCLSIRVRDPNESKRVIEAIVACEDARVTYVEPLRHYVMTYTALSSDGPRIAFAMSEDLFHGERIGLAKIEAYRGIDFVRVDHKDASVFPVVIPNHAGKMQLAMLHRPLFRGTRPEETVRESESRTMDCDHESIWISYCPMPPNGFAAQDSGLFNSHHRLATPVAPWEHRQRILYRSPEPVLTPESPEELRGTIANVVFLTGIDRRDDLGMPDRFDVYYGMADSRIGVASLHIPKDLPVGAPADGVSTPYEEKGV